MRKPKRQTSVSALLITLGLASVHGNNAAARSFQTIPLFSSAGDFYVAFSTDAAGNIYIPAPFPGPAPNGALYEATAASGYSRARLLYNFGAEAGTYGAYPNSVTLTGHNVVLGTAEYDGVGQSGTIYNLGTARAIAPSVLHAFSGGSAKPLDGANPESGLTAGPNSRYYGTTIFGGTGANANYAGNGVVYQISQSSTDPHYKVLHFFGGRGDGINPSAGNLAVDPQGNLYGETINGGANGLGTVFMLQYVSGAWQEHVIYSFQPANDLQLPAANVAIDTQGNLYGCAQGGTHNRGGIFRLTPPAQPDAAWQETVLYNFGELTADPVAAYASPTGSASDSGCGIALDPATNLIVGTSYGGGFDNDGGTIFTLTPPTADRPKWVETVGHSFKGGIGGTHPSAPPLEVGGVYYGGAQGTTEIYAFTP